MLSLHDENQCRNVWRRMWGQIPRYASFVSSRYLFPQCAVGRGSVAPPPTVPPITGSFFLQTWKTSWISDSAPDFSDDMNVWKIGQFPGHHFTSQTVFPALHGGLFYPRFISGLVPCCGISLVHSHWSRNVEARLSLVESFPSDACASSLMP